MAQAYTVLVLIGSIFSFLVIAYSQNLRTLKWLRTWFWVFTLLSIASLLNYSGLLGSRTLSFQNEESIISLLHIVVNIFGFYFLYSQIKLQNHESEALMLERIREYSERILNHLAECRSLECTPST